MTHDPNRLIGGIALTALASVLLWRVYVWIRQIPIPPDPWDQETEKALHEPEAVEVCHRCFDPVPPGSWFCKKCGCAVGPYNNIMPYLNVFSQGEVLRNGVNDKLRPSAFIVVGYLLVSLSICAIFAPFYWILLFRNLKRQKESVEPTETHHG